MFRRPKVFRVRVERPILLILWKKLPFGLNGCPYNFHKTVRPVFQYLRNKGMKVVEKVLKLPGTHGHAAGSQGILAPSARQNSTVIVKQYNYHRIPPSPRKASTRTIGAIEERLYGQSVAVRK